MRRMRDTKITTAEHVHSTKTIQAANKLSSLISLPGPLTDHSPFFICAIALSAMVNLSAYSLMLNGARADLAKEQSTLAMGALGFFGETWAVAIPIMKEIRIVARRVLNLELANNDLSLNLQDDHQIFTKSLFDNIRWPEQMEDEWSDL